jgi:hypothetical protein
MGYQCRMPCFPKSAKLFNDKMNCQMSNLEFKFGNCASERPTPVKIGHYNFVSLKLVRNCFFSQILKELWPLTWISPPHADWMHPITSINIGPVRFAEIWCWFVVREKQYFTPKKYCWSVAKKQNDKYNFLSYSTLLFQHHRLFFSRLHGVRGCFSWPYLGCGAPSSACPFEQASVGFRNGFAKNRCCFEIPAKAVFFAANWSLAIRAILV